MPRTTIYKSAWYILDGINPEPWEAPQASVGFRNGKPYVQMHKTEQLRAYQESVVDLLPQQNSHRMRMWDGLIELEFFFWRRLDSYGVGDGARSRRHLADATNMQKALEDALQGLLFLNDRNVVEIKSRIMAQGPNVEPRILIKVGERWENPSWIEEKAEHLASGVPRLEPKSNILPDDDLF